MTLETLTAAARAINAGGVVALLVVALWLGYRGDIVGREQIAACYSDRDTYLRELIRYSIPQADTLAPPVTPRLTPTAKP